jgi:hypothetical protein
MWTYRQHSGGLLHDGSAVAVGYAGHEEGRNNPDMQTVHDKGPLPRGRYTIGDPEPIHGGFALRLKADGANEMFGRDGFLIHGDSMTVPGTASLGCIILPRLIRWAIWGSGDHDLEVIE